MFQKLKNWLINCLNIIIGIVIGILISKEKVVTVPEIQYVETIKYDSIYIIIDSIVENIKYIEKEYENKVPTIVNSDDSTNMCIFTEYIDNYQRTIKSN